MRILRNQFFGTAWAIFVFGVALSMAQLPTGAILGTLRDGSGAVVPGARIAARNVETGQTRATESSANGSYRFSALPVGNYEVRVEHAGFQAQVRRGLALTVTQEAVVDFTLLLGAVEETVEVTAEAPLVNTTSGSLGGLVDEQRMADLPLNGRNYIDLTLLQTGVTQHKDIGGVTGQEGIWFSSNGAPLRSNNLLLDGAPLQNLGGAASASVGNTTLGVEGIREYRVITNSFSAEYGMTMGSQMMIVSKNGTNDFHGSLFDYLRNSALDARNFFDRKTAITPRRLPAFTRNQFGGSLGGPIRAERTFFFVVSEALRERLGRTLITNVIPPAAKQGAEIAPIIRPLLSLFPDPNLPNNQYTFPFSQPTNVNYGQVRIDHTFSGNDSVFGRYTIDDSEKIRPRDYPQFRDVGVGRSQFVTVSENHIFSPSLLNTFRFSFSRTNNVFDSFSGIRGPQFSLVPGEEIGVISIGGVTTFGPDGTTPTVYGQDIFTWSDDLFFTRGRHSLKFGTLINRFHQLPSVGTATKGSISFPSLATFLQAQPNQYFAATPGSILDRRFQFTTLGFYVQDDMRLVSNFSLNLGLRYEFQTEVDEARGYKSALRDISRDATATVGTPYKNTSLKNFSPRFGFAWDVRGNGKTAVRGGFGLLYDLGNLGGALLITANGTPPFSSRSTVVNPASLAFPLAFPRETVGKTARIIDYLLEQPHLLQYNLTVERQLPFDMAMTLAYAGSRGINLIQTTEGNPTVPQGIPQAGRCLTSGTPPPFVADGPKCWTGQDPRTNPNWANIELKTAGSSSWYNSLQLGFLKRLSAGLQFQSSYTWSKLLDMSQGQWGGENSLSNSTPTDPSNLKVEKGPAQFDVAHNWQFNAIYRLPNLTSGASILSRIVNDWGISGILALQSGYPFTPNLSANRSRSQVAGAQADRPDLAPGRNNDNIILGGPDRYFDPSAFTIPAAGFLGTAGRNILRGPGFANLDASLAKDAALGFLGESGKLEFRAEFFNILNRANFFGPDRVVYAGRADVENPLPTVGRITRTVSTARQIQFALKVRF